MRFEVFSEIEYSVVYPTTFIFNIHALRSPNQTVLEETLTIDPHIRVEEFVSSNMDNRFVRLQVAEPLNFKISYKAIVDTYYQVIGFEKLQDVQVAQMEGNIIPFLFPSRYCQSDKLMRLANDKFGSIENTYVRVLAITEWINKNVEYVSGSTNASTSAYDTITERTGVCRDFAHLGIALCRAVSVPARYFTGYAYQLNPPDFHACFEAFIGGRWIIFDATKLVPLNGLVKIANGRDAADAAVSSTFGRVNTTGMMVGCNALDDNFTPVYYNASSIEGVSFDGPY